MSNEGDLIEIAMIDERLAKLFARGAQLQHSLALLAKKAFDEEWTDEAHEEARQSSLEEMNAARMEIHKLADRLTELKSRSSS
jgi:hypothetical protein